MRSEREDRTCWTLEDEAVFTLGHNETQSKLRLAISLLLAVGALGT